jgi:hypothetical protein
MPPPRGSRFVPALRFQQKRQARALISQASGPMALRALLVQRLPGAHRVPVALARQRLPHRVQVVPAQVPRHRVPQPADRLVVPRLHVRVAVGGEAERPCRLLPTASRGVMLTPS